MKIKKNYQKLNFSEINSLIEYYQIQTENDSSVQNDKIRFNVSFDKNKIHSLFHTKNVLYSEVLNKELYLLPILIKKKIFCL